MVEECECRVRRVKLHECSVGIHYNTKAMFMDQTNLVFNLRVIRFEDELLPDRYPFRSAVTFVKYIQYRMNQLYWFSNNQYYWSGLTNTLVKTTNIG